MKAPSVRAISRILTLVVFLLILTSCSTESETERVSSDAKSDISETERTVETRSNNAALDPEIDLFEGRGKVVKLIANGSFIEIDHGDIPGYMSAMSMMFPVDDTTMIRGIMPDDSVRFQMSGSGEIFQISRIGD